MSKSKCQINYYPKIFEISPHPSPLPTGEREGVRGQNVRRKFLDSRCKNQITKSQTFPFLAYKNILEVWILVFI
jgi:hypothetical protein